MAEQGSKSAADGGARTEHHQQKESEHGGRQDQRQGSQRLDSRQPAAAPEYQQSGQRHGHSQQNRCCDRCELEGEGERLPIHGFQ
jgi:hypothetical protein